MRPIVYDVIISPVHLILGGGWKLLAVLVLLVVAVTLLLLWIRRTGRK